MKITLERQDDAYCMQAANEEGKSIIMDAGASVGGNDKGMRPMQLLIAGLGGCSSVDIISILKKQRQTLTDIKIEIDAERPTDKEPALFEDITIKFKLFGDIDPAKAEKAVSLSLEKYCSVAKTLEAAGARITYSIEINK